MYEHESIWPWAWIVLGWLFGVTGAGALFVWGSLVLDKAPRRGWMGMAAFALLFVTGQSVAGALTALRGWNHTDILVVYSIKLLIFLAAVPFARRYFKCSWFAAIWLAVLCGALARLAWPWRI